ncbi:uncharacterized protein LOC113214258 [Frankliniella occidentalis]|uniref:Uncharacterized protein LOC113214258 n=1 Tax=Frankliniella occidentalis TaxID=133901 RepID=A0A6J1T918_FRAOC|nr:uncharacterized protein LOC113214258 [Frankliniella occidentalis]
MAEIVNRTLKTPLWKHFEYTNSWRWIEPLSQIVSNYNHTIHGATGMAPADVSEKDVFKIWSTIYLRHTAPQLLRRRQRAVHKTNERGDSNRRVSNSGGKATTTAPVFKPGQFVRISLTKEFTEKGYTAKFSRQIYKVAKVIPFSPVHMYTLTDLNGESIVGRFYGHELQRITPPTSDTVYRIERILDRRGRKGRDLQYLVRWAGYDKNFDSWVPERDLQDIEELKK